MPFTPGDLIQIDRNAVVWPFVIDDPVPIKWGLRTRLDDWTIAIVIHSPPPPNSYVPGTSTFTGNFGTFNTQYCVVATTTGHKYFIRNCDASLKARATPPQ